MEIVKRPLSELHPSEMNVRKHTQQQIDEFARSIQMFGVIRPIVCDETGRILVGHGLYEALQSLGKETADCIVVSGLSKAKKNKLMLADNKIFSLGIDNYQSIDEIMKSLAMDGDFDIPGYDASTLDDLYGIKSIEKSAEENIATQKQMPDVVPHPFALSEDPTPTRQTQEEREKAQINAKKFIICPYCGERIDMK